MNNKNTENNFIQLEEKYYKHICSGCYIIYTRSDDKDRNEKKGYVLGQWSKNESSGLIMANLPIYKKKENNYGTWTISFSNINSIKKKIDKSIAVEYHIIMDKLQEGRYN